MMLNPAIFRRQNVEIISDGDRIAALITWLLFQVLALLLAAARVPLWARFGGPIQSWALCWMLVVQVGASALLFPWLMADLRAGASLMLTSLPFILLAGMLSRATVPMTISACAGVLAWLSALAAWKSVLTNRTTQLVAASIASLATIGAACVLYLAIEFNDASISVEKVRGGIWIALGVNLVAGISAVIVRRVLRAKLSTG